jgi:hypothetical protein
VWADPVTVAYGEVGSGPGAGGPGDGGAPSPSSSTGAWGAGSGDGDTGGPDPGPVRPGLRAFFFFYLIYRGGHLDRLGKCLIYRDLWIETNEMPASVNLFCPPPIKFL